MSKSGKKAILRLSLGATIFSAGGAGGVIAGLAYSIPRAVSAWAGHAAHPNYADPSLMNWIVLVLSLLFGLVLGAFASGGALLGLMVSRSVHGGRHAEYSLLVLGAVLGLIPLGLLTAAVLSTNFAITLVVVAGVAATLFFYIYMSYQHHARVLVTPGPIELHQHRL